MKKLRKLCVVLSLLLVLSFFVAVPASAASLIDDARGDLSDTGSLRVSWNATTFCSDTVDLGTITIYTQKYNGSSWVTVGTDHHQQTNTNLIADSGSRSVSQAGTYRIKTYHSAYLDGTSQTKSFTSTSIYVN